MECLIVLIALLPLVPPVIIGRQLFKMAEEHGRNTPLAPLAAWLTLSPLITTPIWLVILSIIPNSSRWHIAHFLSILPGAGVSLLALFLAWPHFTAKNARAAWLLLGLDCLRWGNSFLIAAPARWSEQHWLPPWGLVWLIGILGPTIYGLTALMLAQWPIYSADVSATTQG